MANRFEHIVGPGNKTNTCLDEVFLVLSCEAVAEAVALTAWSTMEQKDRLALQAEAAAVANGDGPLAQSYIREVLILRSTIPTAAESS